MHQYFSYGVSEEEEKKEGTEKIFKEIIFENFPNMGKEIVNQIQKAQSHNQDYCAWQRPHSKLMEKSKAFQTSKS